VPRSWSRAQGRSSREQPRPRDARPTPDTIRRRAGPASSPPGIAGCPVAGSQRTNDSVWLAIPIAATSPSPCATTSETAASAPASSASGSCSTTRVPADGARPHGRLRRAGAGAGHTPRSVCLSFPDRPRGSLPPARCLFIKQGWPPFRASLFEPVRPTPEAPLSQGLVSVRSSPPPAVSLASRWLEGRADRLDAHRGRLVLRRPMRGRRRRA
jgi:hypothetical protein